MEKNQLIKEFNLQKFVDFINEQFVDADVCEFDFYNNEQEVMERFADEFYPVNYDFWDVLTDNAGLNTTFWQLEDGSVVSERYSGGYQYVLGYLVPLDI